MKLQDKIALTFTGTALLLSGCGKRSETPVPEAPEASNVSQVVKAPEVLSALTPPAGRTNLTSASSSQVMDAAQKLLSFDTPTGNTLQNLLSQDRVTISFCTNVLDEAARFNVVSPPALIFSDALAATNATGKYVVLLDGDSLSNNSGRTIAALNYAITRVDRMESGRTPPQPGNFADHAMWSAREEREALRESNQSLEFILNQAEVTKNPLADEIRKALSRQRELTKSATSNAQSLERNLP